MNREEKIELLERAVALARVNSTDWAQQRRLTQALVDVVVGTVLPRTEVALAEALRVCDAR